MGLKKPVRIINSQLSGSWSTCTLTLLALLSICKTDEVHAFLRTVLASLYDEEVAQATRIQYGGSVTPDSVDELMAQPEIDGCLVGGGMS